MTIDNLELIHEVEQAYKIKILPQERSEIKRKLASAEHRCYLDAWRDTTHYLRNEVGIKLVK